MRIRWPRPSAPRCPGCRSPRVPGSSSRRRPRLPGMMPPAVGSVSVDRIVANSLGRATICQRRGVIVERDSLAAGERRVSSCIPVVVTRRRPSRRRRNVVDSAWFGRLNPVPRMSEPARFLIGAPLDPVDRPEWAVRRDVIPRAERHRLVDVRAPGEIARILLRKDERRDVLGEAIRRRRTSPHPRPASSHGFVHSWASSEKRALPSFTYSAIWSRSASWPPRPPVGCPASARSAAMPDKAESGDVLAESIRRRGMEGVAQNMCVGPGEKPRTSGSRACRAGRRPCSSPSRTEPPHPSRSSPVWRKAGQQAAFLARYVRTSREEERLVIREQNVLIRRVAVPRTRDCEARRTPETLSPALLQPASCGSPPAVLEKRATTGYARGAASNKP